MLNISPEAYKSLATQKLGTELATTDSTGTQEG